MQAKPLVTSCLNMTPSDVSEVLSRAIMRKADGQQPSTQSYITSNFFDSGAFSLGSRVRLFLKDNPSARPEDYYESDEFAAYCSAYAQMILDYPDAAEFYANIDVIHNAELTYKNQKRLEGLGVSPVPVVHFGTDLKWLRRYLDEGYDFIGVGGLVGGAPGGSKQVSKDSWLHDLFEIICPRSNDNYPIAKTHGFGVSTISVVRKYPWYSIDSAAWTKTGAYGRVLVPRRNRGQWDLTKDFKVVAVSRDSPERSKPDGSHLFCFSAAEREVVREWFEDELLIPLGDRLSSDDCLVTNTYWRRIANLYTTEIFMRNQPPWYRQWYPTKKKGLSLV